MEGLRGFFVQLQRGLCCKLSPCGSSANPFRARVGLSFSAAPRTARPTSRCPGAWAGELASRVREAIACGHRRALRSDALLRALTN